MSVLLKRHTFKKVVIHIDYYLWKPLLFFYLNCAFTCESGFNRIGFHSKTHYTEWKGVLKPLCNQTLNVLLLKPTISPLVTHYVSDKGFRLLFSEVSFFHKSFDITAIIYLITANRNVEKTWIETNTTRVKFYFTRWISSFKIAAIIISFLLLARFLRPSKVVWVSWTLTLFF